MSIRSRSVALTPVELDQRLVQILDGVDAGVFDLSPGEFLQPLVVDATLGTVGDIAQGVASAKPDVQKLLRAFE